MKFIFLLLFLLAWENISTAQDQPHRFHIASPQERHDKMKATRERQKREALRKKELFRSQPFDSSYHKGFLLGTNIATLTDPVEWGPAITAEYRFARRWAVSAAFKGILVTRHNDPDKYEEQHVDSKGYRGTATVMYFLPLAKRFKWFTGIEGMYKRLDYNVFIPHERMLGNYDPLPGFPTLLQPQRTEIHTVHTLGAGPVLGLQMMLGRHVQFEWYMGFLLARQWVDLHGFTPTAGELPLPVIRPVTIRVIPNFPATDEYFSKNAWTNKLPLGVRFSYYFGGRHSK